jgi:serine protease AprX
MRTAAVALLMTMLPASAVPGMRASDEPLIGVIVRTTAAGANAAASAIVEAGGAIGRALPIISGFTADIPTGAMDAISNVPGVTAVSIDAKVRPMDLSSGAPTANVSSVPSGSTEPSSPSTPTTGDVPSTDGTENDGANANGTPMSDVTRLVGAQSLWERGITGRGVDVALIDTGVSPVAGMPASQLIDGPDLSFDSQSEVHYLDQYGHGTHMAGIIAGRDDNVYMKNWCEGCHEGAFIGVAPQARIVNVKVGAFDGATDVSQVIAAIDWVVQHRRDNGMNIRVLNLSFGTDSQQSYIDDPLAYAAEVAWRKGIFVSVASGNDGLATPELAMPASDPFVLAVGALDTNDPNKTGDDTVPEWSQRGTPDRMIDVVAPGVSIESLDVPGSFVNEHYETVHSGRYLRGSGTSQAAAVASGVAALMFQKYPNATPDQVKHALRTSARPMSATYAGYIAIDAKSAAKPKELPAALPQPYQLSVGTGSLELSRGTVHVEHDGVALTGEQDIFGTPWDGQRWSAEAWSETSWNGGTWNGQRWSGSGWEGQRWSGQRWSADMWDGQRWSAQRWSDMSWDGQRWSGTGWNGQRWSSDVWEGQRWSGQRWSGQRWSSQRWSGSSWS